MIVCVCNRISHRDIERVASRCDSFDELQMCTGVATSCGRCEECAHAVFREARQGQGQVIHISRSPARAAAAA